MKDNPYLKWLSSGTESIYWHDSAIVAEQETAFSNGAAGMTTNPFLINGTLSTDRATWKPSLAALDQNLAGDEKALALTKIVAGYFAGKVEHIFRAGEVGKGYVCAQTNPNRTGDSEYMVGQAKILASWAPNIVVKLPATAAGIRAYEECVASGLNVAATLSFTVPQVLAVAEAGRKGKERALARGVKPGLAIAVLMVGRLDDYLRDVAKDSGSGVKESDIIQAGTACIKGAYSIYREKGYDAILMPAGCRGAYHVTALAGARMIMSIAPKIADSLADKPGPFNEGISDPVPEDVIDRLMTLPEFRKAYEPDGMKPEEFITFGSTNRTTSQFIECGWNPLVNMPMRDN